MIGGPDDPRRVRTVKAALTAEVLRKRGRTVPPLVAAYPETADALADALEQWIAIVSLSSGSFGDTLYAALERFINDDGSTPRQALADELAELHDRGFDLTTELMEALDNAHGAV